VKAQDCWNDGKNGLPGESGNTVPPLSLALNRRDLIPEFVLTYVLP
jgi:hypothetical protein